VFRSLLFYIGSAVYVYGAPRAGVVSGAHQQVCLDDRCTEIDVAHAYLNPPQLQQLSADTLEPEHQLESPLTNIDIDTNDAHELVPVLEPEHQLESPLTDIDIDTNDAHELVPVLLYSVNGLDDMRSHTIRLELTSAADFDPYEAPMTISKIVYTEVRYDNGNGPRMPPPPPAPYPPSPPATPPHAVPLRTSPHPHRDPSAPEPVESTFWPMSYAYFSLLLTWVLIICLIFCNQRGLNPIMVYLNYRTTYNRIEYANYGATSRRDETTRRQPQPPLGPPPVYGATSRSTRQQSQPPSDQLPPYSA
jgi:hypothetical protein